MEKLVEEDEIGQSAVCMYVHMSVRACALNDKEKR